MGIPPKNGVQRERLTQSQLLIWTGQKLNPDIPLYNVVFSFHFHGKIDVEAFTKAFIALVKGTPALRTVFIEDDGEPFQEIQQEMPEPILFLDLSAENDPEESFKKWEAIHCIQQLDISKKPFESALICLGEEHYVWYINQHHLTTDAWSVRILYRHLAANYKRALEGKFDELEHLPSHLEFVRYEQEIIRDNQQAEALAFWKEKVQQAPPPAPLYGYTGHKYETRADRILLSLGKERTAQLRALTKEPDLRALTTDLSLFNIFSTLLFAFLYRVSGQKKLSIGTPAHNRPNLAFKETPGLFISFYPLFAELDPKSSFGTLFQQIRKESQGFLRYAQPGALSTTLSRSFNVILNYIHASFPDFHGVPVVSDWINPDHIDSAHYLRLQVHDYDQSGSLDLHFDLSHEVFDEQTRQLLPGHFLQLVDAFISDRSQAIHKPSLLSAAEQSDFQNKAEQQNDTSVSALSLWEKAALQYKDQIAISHHGKELTYVQLEQKANQLARYLSERGVAKDQLVAIYITRSRSFVIAALAIWKLGAAYVPVASNYPRERVTYMLENSGASTVLTTEALTTVLEGAPQVVIPLDKLWDKLSTYETSAPPLTNNSEALAYVMYTSGSTGKPKGVMVLQSGLGNYLQWASVFYAETPRPVMPLFTSLGFDLTVTSLYWPLISGGKLIIYEEGSFGADMALFDVLEDNDINAIKLTPSHLRLLTGKEFPDSKIKTIIVGGEDFPSDLAYSTFKAFEHPHIYNEYGPTEATVGCICYAFNPKEKLHTSLPIGQAIANMQGLVLDEELKPVPNGVVGELYLKGRGLAAGYWKRPSLTSERFIPNPFSTNSNLYKTGDLVRINEKNLFEFLGRKDLQVKIRGHRIELGEIETALRAHPEIDEGIVIAWEPRGQLPQEDIHYCLQCGLPSDYPDAVYDEHGVCNLCNSFDSYQQKARQYFRNLDDLKALFEGNAVKGRKYDCLMLLSGGKDSTYALAQLVELGLSVMAFTLDNGYISEQAKDNIRRVVKELGVDHVFGETPAMDAIFVDSLHRHSNVCNGCFKTIYTLSVQLALEHEIPFIVTGLSRGQFFETRLTEELFWKDEIDVAKIDEAILNARKAYHQVDDAVCRLLDVSMFADDQVFEKVQFVDFYRFTDVSLEEMLYYLENKIAWSRPTDTGRSTNCLINQVGIYVHKKEKGFSNYAFPYSWDVRIGHKTRDESIDEINEYIDEDEVKRIMGEIGYVEQVQAQSEKTLVAYYSGNTRLPATALREFLQNDLPDYMIPSKFIFLEAVPLTPNGKIDRQALPSPDGTRPDMEVPFTPPRTEFEELISPIWAKVLHLNEVGVLDDFLNLGGNSLLAIRIMARVNETFELDLPLKVIFEHPTIALLAEFIEQTIISILEKIESENQE